MNLLQNLSGTLLIRETLELILELVIKGWDVLCGTLISLQGKTLNFFEANEERRSKFSYPVFRKLEV